VVAARRRPDLRRYLLRCCRCGVGSLVIVSRSGHVEDFATYRAAGAGATFRHFTRVNTEAGVAVRAASSHNEDSSADVVPTQTVAQKPLILLTNTYLQLGLLPAARPLLSLSRSPVYRIPGAR
jgi:hypothetical protein